MAIAKRSLPLPYGLLSLIIWLTSEPKMSLICFFSVNAQAIPVDSAFNSINVLFDVSIFLKTSTTTVTISLSRVAFLDLVYKRAPLMAVEILTHIALYRNGETDLEVNELLICSNNDD